ncbi:aminotransferase class III-fold pyridoxal phosphate-dependent enzyme [Thermaerobacter subterraneus]|uniref:Ornithine/acetylornithine aminotransferase n=1 Tax=Thermaerobacter subterraneus DSM 13965 TaxID=867903 RepID=K6QE39_9FIRM|nr:aminotransferase class III-fold pyridoxal phosphate-dependent enzyme [Thermaerobacter subterraneus]EKP95021.1 ornithine/acetylornithine aminotransferase [Thermaerobacter subterraneus DSM 13965]
MHPFRQYVNPHLAELLEQIQMDKRFVRGEGCWLWDDQGRRYLDFVAAYGALPFGFNPPEIWAALEEARHRGEPSFVQPSFLNAAGELARRLIEVAPPGLRYVTFANSGAEAVEAAIKLARAATGRPRILSTDNGFHGKTFGALSATHRAAYQDAFFAPAEGFDKVPYGDLEALERALAARPGEYAAFLVEPIQGEGGIVVPPPGYLREAREVCRRHGVLFIADEVQTGLGRTGVLFACQAEGVTPDAITLAKALGGGLMPIGAVLCTEEVYTEEFATKHSSTFAGNTLACRAGLAALDLLTRDEQALVRHVAETGEYLRQGLLAIQRRHPRVIREVRGRGFMLGIQFGVDREAFPGNLLGVMGEQELLTPVIASYLLNVEGLRVAPTLNGADVIRIEPPLIATRAECDYALAAIERVVELIDRDDTAALLRHLVSPQATTGQAVDRPARHQPALLAVRSREPEEAVAPSGDPREGRFAFLVHPVDLENYPEFDPSLAAFSRAELEELAGRWNHLLKPFRIGRTRVVSAAGATAYGEFYAVPRTADEFLAMPQAEAVAEIEEAIELARENGARIVGLGAYTSVVTRGGLHLRDAGVALTTGNSFTVVAAVEAIAEASRRLGFPLGQGTVAVVGATGAIGRATALLLAGEVRRLVLIGNPARPEQSRRRLLRVAADLARHVLSLAASGRPLGPLAQVLVEFGGWPDPAEPAEAFLPRLEAWLAAGRCPLVVTTDLDAMLPQADVVVTATSSTAHLVTPRNVKFGAVVCDLSRPPNVSREVGDARPDVLVIDGGVIEVPGRPSMGWNFGFERGLVYACMAETMMLALEHHYRHTSLGADLNLETILWLKDLARQHGFRLAELRSFDRPLPAEAWERVLAARSALGTAAR